MKHFKILIPFILLIGLFSFMPSDTAINADTTEIKTEVLKPSEIKPKKVTLDAKTTICYEKINALQLKKEYIQNSIDSVFNVLDSLQISNDTTRHGKKVLSNRIRSKEGFRSLLSKRSQQKDNRLEGYTINDIKQPNFDKQSHLLTRLSNFENKAFEGSKNSNSGGWDNNINSNTFIYSINAESKFNAIGNSWNDNRGGNYIFCSIPTYQNQKQNRFFGNTEGEKCRVRQTNFYFRGTNQDTLIS